MPKPLGLPKSGGRKKGTRNKKTEFVHSILTDLGYDPLKEIVAQLPNIDPVDQINVALKLMEYCYPKKRSLIEEGEEQELIRVIVK